MKKNGALSPPSPNGWRKSTIWSDSIYRQNYLRVAFNYQKDSALIATSRREVNDTTLKSLPKYEVNKPVRIYFIDFTGDRIGSGYAGRWLKNIHFKEDFEFYYLQENRFGFVNCTFEKLFQPRLMETRFFFRFIDCHFKGMVNINNPSQPTPFRFRDCTIDGLLVMSAIDSSPTVEFINTSATAIYIRDKVNILSMDSSSVGMGIMLDNMSVNNSISITNSEIGGLDINGSNLPSANSYLPFDLFKNKLGLGVVRRNLFTGLDSVSNAYKGVTNEELMDKLQFDKLIASYYKLLSIYKTRGELDSYNACYIEMRDKQTARSRLFYENDPSFNRYFDYQIARFTKVFSDYGTRPAKAIVIFFQVVLAFSVFYFFFPSSWNTTNSEKMMKRLSYLGSYFTSKEGLSDLFEKETKNKYRNYEEFKGFMASSEKELPFYFQLMSKPLYHMSVARFNFTSRLLGRTDILNGRWVELPKGKRLLTSLVIGLYLVFYMLYVILIRCLNAITLSLNAFSTLGFGEIPTRGLARYVTIVQGFVGWFLLSIFLVSLIGQILN